MSLRPSRLRWLGAIALPCIAIALGCAGIPTEEIPTDAIAVLHWDRDAFRKREEILHGQMPGGPLREGVASVDNLKKWLSSISGAESLRELSRYPGHLKLLNPRTGELTKVEAAPAGARPVAWSRDRTKLLFATTAGGKNYQIYQYDLEKDEVQAITYGSETHITADYGPDDGIIFGGIELTENPPVGQIYRMQSPTGVPKVLTRGALAERVRWSPDGDRLVFVIRQQVRGDRDGRPILVSQTLGEEDAELRKLGAGRDVVFTPDGEWLVYSAPVGDSWRLRRMRADGSARSPMGPGIRDEASPAVSPDGRFVAYVGREGELDRIFLRRMDGTGDRVLLADGSFGFPVW